MPAPRSGAKWTKRAAGSRPGFRQCEVLGQEVRATLPVPAPQPQRVGRCAGGDLTALLLLAAGLGVALGTTAFLVGEPHDVGVARFEVVGDPRINDLALSPLGAPAAAVALAG